MRNSTDEYASALDRAREGDPDAIQQLVREYEPDVRAVARVQIGAALRPYLDTVDLMQSVHRSLMVGLRENKFDISSPDKLVALAMTIVRRKVARHWQRVERQQRHSRAAIDSYGLSQLLVSLSDPQDNPAGKAEFQDQVEHLCHNLNETERRLIELRFQGLSTADVARRLNLDADALRVHLSRLRQRLKQIGALMR